MTIKGQSSGASLGAFQVVTTSHGGHSVEFWIDDITAQIINVSDSAPPGIREQALAYRESIRAVLDAGIRQAILSNHTTLIYQLRKAGMEEAAALVLTMRS
jgi:threonyl-tRNA synthetase